MKTEVKQGRGQLTERIKQRSEVLLGYQISQKELRLMPYIQYAMVNEQRIKPEHINIEEREILAKWRKKGYIEGGASGLNISEKFWKDICEIIFLGYVDLID